MSTSGRSPNTSIGDRSAPVFTEPSSAGRPRWVGIAWGLLILNTLGSTGADTVIPLPRPVSQLITMGALVLALAIALALNTRLMVRRSAYLVLLTVLLAVSVLASADLEAGFGALFRCFRLSVFVVTLWLLTRWWEGGFGFARYHVRGYVVVLVTVVVGLVAAPGKALSEEYGGRLAGALWPLTPPQVGQYAAIITGLTLLMWLASLVDRTSALIVIVPSVAVLLLTHTRTATFALLAGLGVALVSMALTNARARKVFTGLVLAGAFVAVALGSFVQTWLLRGQSEENFSSLTGRAKVWDALLDAPRTTMEHLFGVGLTDKSYDGLPIDNSWLAVYHEQGVTGVVIVAAFLLVLVVVAVLRPPSPARACALFLVVYCIAASYTEAGLGDASPYLLHLALAASLLVHVPTTQEEMR